MDCVNLTTTADYAYSPPPTSNIKYNNFEALSKALYAYVYANSYAIRVAKYYKLNKTFACYFRVVFKCSKICIYISYATT